MSDLLPVTKSTPSGPEPFRAGRFAMLRLATLPATSADRTRVGLDPDAASAEELSAFLRELVSDPLVREAIEVSSSSLAGTLDRVDSGTAVEPAKLRRAVLSAVRYVLRMSGRSTPFGLFAGVSSVRIGEAAKVRVGDRHAKHARPDAGWLNAVLVRLLRIPAVRERLRLVVNNLCDVRGDRLVLPYVRQPDGTQPERMLSVGYSPVVRAAVEAAQRPIGYPELRTRLTTTFPEADDADADRLLGQLIDREILLTDLAARWDVPDQFGWVRSQLRGIDHQEVAALDRTVGALDAYASTPVGAGRAAWRHAVAELSASHRTQSPPIQVDLRVDAEVTLPQAILNEVAQVGGVLWRLAPPGNRRLDLSSYHDEFLERYGSGRLVPVREVLDPHLGLGPPAGYRQPPGERTAPSPPEDFYARERDEVLAAALDGSRDGELVLDAELVDRLSGGPGAIEDVPPDSLELCVQLFAESAEAVTAGDYSMAIAPGAGSQTAGAMCGRFAGLLGAQAQLAELFEPTHDAGPPTLPVRAQLFFQPAQPRNGNVARMPNVLPYRVPVGCFDDLGDERVLDVRELAVASDGRRLRLFAPSLGREVSVLRPHMLTLQRTAPNLARFLVGLDLTGIRQWTSWQWGRLDVLPSLPRVRYGRTVLCPALWRPSTELADRTLSWPEWQRALGNWRERYGVPRSVRVSESDHHIELDLTVTLHQRLLRDHMHRHPGIAVWESPTRYGDLGLTAGRANEIVVPLLSRTPRQAAPIRVDRPVGKAIGRRHPPGGAWLYAKLYLATDLQDALLAREVRALVERMDEAADRWFFLRYRDPESHLRLRFHGPADRTLPLFHAWAKAVLSDGLVRNVVLDTYEPEVERYGGAEALPYAERLFHADSVAVLEHIALRASRKLTLPVETLAAANYVELLSGMGEWDWRHWVLDAFPVELSNQISPAVRRKAVYDMAKRHSHGQRISAAKAYGEAIGVPAGPDRMHVAGVLSVLHMHANRLIGIDREAERRSYGLLRAAVRKQLDERRHRQ